MGQFVPGTGESVFELVLIFQKAAGDLFVGRVHLEREVGREHEGLMGLALYVCIGDESGTAIIFWSPLMRSGGRFGQFPLKLEHEFEIVVTPLGGSSGPGPFQTTGDRVFAMTLTVGVFPAHVHFGNACSGGFVPDVVFGVGGSVGFTKSMPPGDQRDGFLVVHGHAPEGFADVCGRSHGIGIAFHTFRVDVDQPHVRSREGLFQLTGLIAFFGAEPDIFRAPVNIFGGFPDIGATAGETESFEAHGFQGDVTGQDHQVGPGDLAAVFFLDGPQ